MYSNPSSISYLQVLDASLNFYPIWPEYIRERTAFTVGWSYIVCWVGLGLTLVAREAIQWNKFWLEK